MHGQLAGALAQLQQFTHANSRADQHLQHGTLAQIAAGRAQYASELLDNGIHLFRDARVVTLFYNEPLPGNASIRVTVNGDQLQAGKEDKVDADNDHQPGGTCDLEFNALSRAMVPNTGLCGCVMDHKILDRLQPAKVKI